MAITPEMCDLFIDADGKIPWSFSPLNRSNFYALLIDRYTGSLFFCKWGREKLLFYNETNFLVRCIPVGKLLVYFGFHVISQCENNRNKIEN